MVKIKEKNVTRLMWIVLGAHIIISIVMLMLYGTGHPLLRFMKNWPIIVQLLLTCISGFLIYVVSGYILLMAFGNRQATFKSTRLALLVLSGVLTVTFLILFAITYMTHKQSPWLIYSLMNPVFGNVLLENAIRSWWMLLWLPSASLPALGLLVGMGIHAKQGER